MYYLPFFVILLSHFAQYPSGRNAGLGRHPREEYLRFLLRDRSPISYCVPMPQQSRPPKRRQVSILLPSDVIRAATREARRQGVARCTLMEQVLRRGLSLPEIEVTQ
jgi:hypothetical protein